MSITFTAGVRPADPTQEQLDELQVRVGEDEEVVAALDARVGALESEDTSSDGRLDAVESDISTVQSDATALAARVTTVESDIDALQATDVSLDGRLDTAESDIDAVQSAATTLTGRVTTAEGTISSQGTRLTTAEGTISSQGTRLTTAEGNITSLQAADTTLGSRTTKLEGGKAFDYNVKADYSAVGDGTTDDTAAIQAALTAASGSSGKKVFFPSGTYKITSTLTVSDTAGITLEGLSEGSVIFQCTSALSDLPVLKLTDVHDSYFRNITFHGVNIVTKPKCAIQVNRGAGTGSTVSSNNHFQNLYIGGPSVQFQYGIRLTNDTGNDTNNDLHTFEDITFANIETACLYIGHGNSLAHSITNVGFGSFDTGIYAEAGSFRATNCWFYCLGTDLKLGMNAAAIVQAAHPFVLTNCGSESNGKVLQTVADNVEVYMTGYDRQGGYVGVANQIDIGGASSTLVMYACRMQFGQPTNKLNIGGSGCRVSITNSRLGFTHIVGGASGDLRLLCNSYDTGTVDLSGLSSTCKKTYLGEYGGNLTSTSDTLATQNFTSLSTTAPGVLSSNFASTSTNTDEAWQIRSANALLTTSGYNNAASIVGIYNGSTLAFKATANGMFYCLGPSNNSAPGFYIKSGSSGGKALMRTTGGNGEYLDFSGDGGISFFQLGYATGTIHFGPSGLAGAEILIDSSSTTFKSSTTLKHGTTNIHKASAVAIAAAAAVPSTLNISTQGVIDWLTLAGSVANPPSFTHKKKNGEGDMAASFGWYGSAVTGLSVFTSTSTCTVSTTATDEAYFGTSALSSAGDVGIFTNTTSTGYGYSFKCAAVPTTRTLKLYCGVYRGVGTLTCTLPDGTTATQTVTSLGTDVAENYALFTVTFNSLSFGQFLQVKFELTTYSGTGANVKFITATLA